MKTGIRTLGRGLLLATVTCAAAQPAGADVLFATRGDRLLRIDTDTVSGEEVGSTGLGQIAGMTFGCDGVLYGVVAFSNLLVSIDPETAEGVILGAVGASISPHSGLACDPTTGTLYAISNQGKGTASFLVQISLESSSATPVADTVGKAVVGLGCDADGELYGIDGAVGKEELVRIDKASGALVPVLPGGLLAFKSTGALDVGPTGRLWTVNAIGSGYELVEIDPADGFPTSHGFIQGMNGTGALNGLAGEPAVGLQVFPPAPGKVGAVNTVMVTGATPGELVTLVYGLGAGAPRLPKCDGVLGIAAPYQLRTQKASAEGVAIFRVPVRPGLEGLTLLLQAVEFETCTTSKVLEVSL